MGHWLIGDWCAFWPDPRDLIGCYVEKPVAGRFVVVLGHPGPTWTPDTFADSGSVGVV